MQRLVVCTFLVTVAAVGGILSNGSAEPNRSPAANQQAADGPKHRTFKLTYGATLTGLAEGDDVRVWLPVPQSNQHQSVRNLNTPLPVTGKTAVDAEYGNKIVFFESKAPSTGLLAFSTQYEIRRNEVRSLDGKGAKVALTDAQRKRFLSANVKVPVAGKQLDLLEGTSFDDDPLTIARTLYDRVDEHVKYDKSVPGYGNGDVAWVCDSRTGNCTDFHSLFISWARSKELPARFEIGFPLPPERGAGTIGGYHCWAMFHTGDKGWVPVDISEADKHPELKEYYFGNLTENRVAFSTGRDITLVPKQAGPPLNYFVYPYVEVNGKPLSRDQIKLRFAFEDQQ